MAKKWQLPAGLVDAIQYHHAVRPSVNDPNLLMTIHVADIIVNTHGADSKANLNLSDIHPDALKVMGGQLETASDWYPEVALEIESACKFFLKEST